MDDRTRAAKVGSRVELVSVSLRNVDARLPSLGQPDGPVELEVSWETAHTSSEIDQLTFVHRLEVTSAEPDGLSVEAAFELVYLVDEGSDLDDDDLQAFAEVSVAFSAHPYARELVQSLTVRASLPPLVLGTLRSPVDPPAANDESEAVPPS